MVFSSIVFLCLFLPVVLIVYYICPVKFRNLWLFLASLLFYAWGEPKYILIMLFSTVFDYCNGRLLEYFTEVRLNETARKLVLAVSVVGNLGILAFFKYTDFVLENVGNLMGMELPLLRLALPIGISFYTFQTMSYTIDVYFGKVKAQHDLISFGMYVCMFPQLIAGPIVRYQHVAAEVDERQATIELSTHGMQRFLMGLGKKVFFANQIGALWSEISVLQTTEQSVALAWLGAFAYTFQIYFDFSGYSDMAIGLGELFGFHFPENFNYPYISKSITEFWRRWHMTLSSWFKEYVYIPLGGNRHGLARQILNLLIVWFLTGLWHGAGWNFIFWGLYYFALLVLEKQFLAKWLEKAPAGIRHFYAMFFVVIGWVLFACEDVGQLGGYLKAMFGIGVPLVNRLAVYEWMTHILFLFILSMAAAGIPRKWIAAFLERNKNKTDIEMAAFNLKNTWCMIILGISIALLVSGSYNPFLYFRF